MTAEIERWLPVAGYKGLYEVSGQGRVRSLLRQTSTGTRGGVILKPHKHLSGHLYVTLYNGNQKQVASVHTLVARAFIGPRPLGLECCHNNGRPSDNRAANLRWDSRARNVADSKAHGVAPLGERHGMARLSEHQVQAIRKDSRTLTSIAADYGVSHQHVSNIKRRLQWAHVP